MKIVVDLTSIFEEIIIIWQEIFNIWNLISCNRVFNFLSTPEATYTSIENRSKKTIEGIDVAQDY